MFLWEIWTGDLPEGGGSEVRSVVRLEGLVKQVQAVLRYCLGAEPSPVWSHSDVRTAFKVIREDGDKVYRGLHETVHIFPSNAELITILQEDVIVRSPNNYFRLYFPPTADTNLVQNLSWCFLGGQLQLLITFFWGTVSFLGSHTSSFTVLHRSLGTLTQSILKEVEHCCLGTRWHF